MLHQRTVQPVRKAFEFGDKEEHLHRRHDKVGYENVTHQIIGAVEPADCFGRHLIYIGAQQEEEKVQHDIPDDVEQLDGSKLHRFLLIAQIGERDALERIECHYNHHHGDIVRMVGVFQKGR